MPLTPVPRLRPCTAALTEVQPPFQTISSLFLLLTMPHAYLQQASALLNLRKSHHTCLMHDFATLAVLSDRSTYGCMILLQPLACTGKVAALAGAHDLRPVQK